MTTTTALRNTTRIAELNDIVRKRCMVPTFDNQGIRHRGERDFGAFDYEGRRIFWKIDYYAPDMCHGSEDPADLAQTVCVLTIMLEFEY
jgi:Protein of unknown function (DUF3768)